MYICPKCRSELVKNNSCFKCENNHSYDISKYGYVNLILGNKACHGDNKAMVEARRSFLQGGKYSIIIEKLSKMLSKLGTQAFTIVDAGCGEGYYTSALKNALPYADIYAFDVSKDAVTIASRACKSVHYSVASVNAIPIYDSSADVVLSLFAPLCEEEFHRVLKPNGILITVSPSPDHLFSLKAKIYDTPYKNPPSTFVPKLLCKTDESTVTDKIILESNNEISNLFTMTPYCYNTGKEGRERIKDLQSLETEIGFVFGVYKK